MSEFIEAAKKGDIPAEGKLCLEIDDRFVVIVNLKGEYFCLDDVCTHDGGPLGEGDLDAGCLVCPRHGARFDVRTGEAETMPATEATVRHDVKLDGESILVRLAAE